MAKEQDQLKNKINVGSYCEPPFGHPYECLGAVFNLSAMRRLDALQMNIAISIVSEDL